MPARLLGIQTGQLLVGISEWFSIRILGFVPSLILRASRLTHNRLAAPRIPQNKSIFFVTWSRWKMGREKGLSHFPPPQIRKVIGFKKVAEFSVDPLVFAQCPLHKCGDSAQIIPKTAPLFSSQRFACKCERREVLD